MYEELIKELRDYAAVRKGEIAEITKGAADAIEELSREYESIAASLNESVELVRKLQQPRWIPVTERLPEQGKQVLVTGIEAIGNVRIYSVKQLDGDVWRPTSAPSCYWEHWMPLPSTEGLNET